MDDSTQKFEHSCGKCGTPFKTTKWKNKHELKCTGVAPYRQGLLIGEDNVDFVTCRECGFKAKTLSKHINFAHNLTKETYLEKYPDALITCKKSSDVFLKRGQNFAWLKRAKERGDDLTAYKKKMGDAVRESILSNPEERERRSKLMGELNKRPEAIKKASETAKKTSARPEIQKARAEKLAKWRLNNFEEFYEKCIKVAHNTYHSKPELALYEILKNVDSYEFKLSQVIMSDSFSFKSKRKQVDICDKDRNFCVEFDGIIHFKPYVKGENVLEQIQLRDAELDEFIIKHNWTLVRISHDQFTYKSGGKFSDDCIKQLFQILSNPQPGVHRIGEAYAITNEV